jgi:hypothetical protein
MLDVSHRLCYKSYRRSNEHLYEGLLAPHHDYPSDLTERTDMATTAPSPFVGTTIRRSRAGVRTTIAPPRRSTRLRLTRRGRAVATLAITLPLLVVALASSRHTADAGTTAVAQMQATGRVVVQPGESLWQLAQELAPQADPRSTVLRIRDLNHLSSDRVEAGQALVVPIFD